MEIKEVKREEYVNFFTDRKNDKFAGTFISKCDMLNRWDDVIGLWDDSELLGAILVTLSKRKPIVANLQLLHTFFKHRGKSVGKILTEYSFKEAIKNDAKYFRVSSEPDALCFYQKIGFKFWGKQKSGCFFSIFKINDENIKNGIYDRENELIKKSISPSKMKGSVVELFEELI